MTRFIPYLAEEAIEHDAEALLDEYAQSRGIVITPPIPIEEIVEKHLKLALSSMTPTSYSAFRASLNATPTFLLIFDSWSMGAARKPLI